MRFPVYGDTPPYLILHHEHPQLFKLLTEFFDVVADDPRADVHVCAVVEHL